MRPALTDRLQTRQQLTLLHPQHRQHRQHRHRAHALRHKRGLSLAEMLIALILFALISDILISEHRNLAWGFAQQRQYRTIWRVASQQAELAPRPPPAGYQVTRQQTPAGQCLQVTVIVTSQAGRQGQLSRLHCPPPP